MNSAYNKLLASMPLTTYHYKILLLLNVKPFTQAEISRMLGICRQNTNRYFKDLLFYNLVEIDRVEGSNKFYHSITDVTLINTQIPGQVSFC